MQKRLTTSDGMQDKTARRVDRTRRLAVLAMVAAVLVSGLVWAAEEEVNNGQDPTRPLTRLDFRYQYQNLPPDDHDNAHIFTLRADKPFVLSQRWQMVAWLDMPLYLTDAISRDNPMGDYKFGTGDLLVQGLVIHALDTRWALAGGV
jgi:hypothetical protein